MFDWNEEDDGVTDTIWVDFDEEENHTVPYPKSGENGALTVGDSWKNKQDNEQRITTGAYIEKSIFDPKNELHGCNLDHHSRFHAEEKNSGSGYHLGLCSSFPFINNAVVEGDNVENDHGSTSSTMVNDLSFDYSKNSRFTEICQSGDLPPSFEDTCGFGEFELDSKPSIFSSEHGQEEDDSFLDCDWGSIQDFDDLDKLFSNSGSIFGHETTSNVYELLSPANSTNTMTSPFPMHETLISVDVSTEKGLSFLETEKSSGKRKRLNCDKVADHTVVKETECHSEITCGHYQLDEKKTSLKPHIELEKKTAVNVGKSAVSENSQVQQFDKYTPYAALQPFQSSIFPPQVQVGGTHFLGYFPYGHQAFTGYGYPAFSFPSIPLLPSPVQATSQQPQPAQLCNLHPQNHARHISSLQIPYVASKMPTMTPEEKIEKLRWRQQMQAMQGKQFGEHVGTADALNRRIPQKSQSRKSCLSTCSKVEEKGKGILPSELNIPVEQEESYFANVTSKCTLQETMFREFQETLMKLDDNLRVCMKESLYRLARNASARHCAKNMSNSHFSITKEDGIFRNEAINFPNSRSFAAIDVETNTNPIDRAVTNLLFHSPQNSSAMIVNEDKPESNESISWECISEVKANRGDEIKGNGILKIS